MKKYIILLSLSVLILPYTSFAQGKNSAIQQVTKQRDIADNNCRNNLPNPNAAIGFCRKRDGLQRKLDNMNNGSNYNNNRYNHNHNNRNYHKNRHNNRHHYNNNHRHNHNYNR